MLALTLIKFVAIRQKAHSNCSSSQSLHSRGSMLLLRPCQRPLATHLAPGVSRQYMPAVANERWDLDAYRLAFCLLIDAGTVVHGQCDAPTIVVSRRESGRREELRRKFRAGKESTFMLSITFTATLQIREFLPIFSRIIPLQFP